jgi:hypothetical protein
MMQKLMLDNQRKALLANGAARGKDHKPVIKLFCPWNGATWLLSELDPENPDIAFALCDLGFGSPELGSLALSELRSIRGPFGLYIERDQHFKADKPISAYATEARQIGRIVA